MKFLAPAQMEGMDNILEKLVAGIEDA